MELIGHGLLSYTTESGVWDIDFYPDEGERMGDGKDYARFIAFCKGKSFPEWFDELGHQGAIDFGVDTTEDYCYVWCDTDEKHYEGYIE